jgi:hypothetical protein
VALFKKLQEFSEEELQSNPQLLKDLGNPEEDTELFLREEGFGSEYEPAVVVFEQAITKYKGDMPFVAQINRLEQGYAKSKAVII